MREARFLAALSLVGSLLPFSGCGTREIQGTVSIRTREGTVVGLAEVPVQVFASGPFGKRIREEVARADASLESWMAERERLGEFVELAARMGESDELALPAEFRELQERHGLSEEEVWERLEEAELAAMFVSHYSGLGVVLGPEFSAALDPVAETRTDDQGNFRVQVGRGDYVLLAGTDHSEADGEGGYHWLIRLDGESRGPLELGSGNLLTRSGLESFGSGAAP